MNRILNQYIGNHMINGDLYRQSVIFDVEQALRTVVEIGRSFTNSFVIDEDNGFVYVNFLKWLYGSDFKCVNPLTGNLIDGDITKGIYIAGGTGTGKSLLLEVMSIYSRMANLRVLMFGKPHTLSWNPVFGEEITQYYSSNGSVSRYLDRDILCIQDLGTEPIEAMNMGNRICPVRHVLEKRADIYSKLTLISSNLSVNDSEIVDRYGERVHSRLLELNYFELIGGDRRKKRLLKK